MHKFTTLQDLLPLNLDNPDQGCIRPNKDVFCFLTGDPRQGFHRFSVLTGIPFQRLGFSVYRLKAGLKYRDTSHFRFQVYTGLKFMEIFHTVVYLFLIYTNIFRICMIKPKGSYKDHSMFLTFHCQTKILILCYIFDHVVMFFFPFRASEQTVLSVLHTIFLR